MQEVFLLSRPLRGLRGFRQPAESVELKLYPNSQMVDRLDLSHLIVWECSSRGRASLVVIIVGQEV